MSRALEHIVGGDRWPRLFLSGAEMTDAIFTCERGSWNVTRALADIAAGKVGDLRSIPVDTALAINNTIDTDPAKVTAFTNNFAALNAPGLLAMRNGLVYVIDGHHRLRARHRMALPTMQCWVLREHEEPAYRVTGLRQDGLSSPAIAVSLYDFQPLR